MKRAPESSIHYDERTQSFHCFGCMEDIEVRRNVAADQEAFLSMREMVELDHQECPLYRDVEHARQARKFRKESKRRELLKIKS